jgi:hypothetical protein
MKYLFFLPILMTLTTQVKAAECRGEKLINGFKYSNAGYGDILPNGKIRGLRYLKEAPTFPYEYLPKEVFVQLIQEFVNQKEGKAFKFIGDYMDFFHGHVLLRKDPTSTSENVKQNPVAILYHTQEFGYVNTDPSCKYLRFAPGERNWFQSVSNPSLITNADGLPGRYGQDENYHTHQTIQPEFLDDENGLPFSNLQNEALQFSFFEAACENIPEKYRTHETNFFTLKVSDETRCFLFTGAGDQCGHPYTLDDKKCDSSWIDPLKENG